MPTQAIQNFHNTVPAEAKVQPDRKMFSLRLRLVHSLVSPEDTGLVYPEDTGLVSPERTWAESQQNPENPPT